ncbi:MAG: phosphate ABC transporter permease PstA [Planctomycetes bacterium]|nr:phosphate ABC transporter permease PstA [Planctomycetota bacterium]
MNAAAPHTSLRARRVFKNRAFLALCLASTTLAIVILAILILSIVMQGSHFLFNSEAAGAVFGHGDLTQLTRIVRWEFLTNFASRRPENAGIYAAIIGTVWVCGICAALTLPLGIGTAIYLEEFAPKNRWTALIDFNIRNLAGVPSIVYGILGLTAFTRMFGLFGSDRNAAWSFGPADAWWHFQLPFGQGLLAGGLTLMLVVLPIVIISSREALRAVPSSLRQASLAIGATPWQTVSRITLPAALPSILTGAILAMSRAVGEAAPLLVLGIPVFIASTPDNLTDSFTVLPFQIFNWAGRPQEAFHQLAASAIVILLLVLICFNGIAVYLRQKLRKPLA